MKTRVFGMTVLLMMGTLFVASAQAATQTVTLDVPGMYCEVCPITVKKSLVQLPGVNKVNVSLKAKEAVVTYDDTKVDVNKLIDATWNAGYPSTVKHAKDKQ